MGISRKLFNGDPQYWDEIADLNDIEAPDYTIYPGQELKLPKPEEKEQGTPTVTDDGKETDQAKAPTEAVPAAKTYTVQSGDTLMEISRKLFNGDPQYWDEIAEFNGIKAPYSLYPGDELKVPEK
jgi:nucleoid-associated protein YgaU